MVDDAFINPKKPNSNNKKKKKKKHGGSKKKMTAEQVLAFKSVAEWAFLEATQPPPCAAVVVVESDFGVQQQQSVGKAKLVFELHSHSKCSDGFLSPSKLVERAHGNGVNVLALTDHDTMAGVPEAIEAARRFGMKIIPGVEISTIFSPGDREVEEPVHILAYYSSCGPARYEQLEKLLSSIRDGRYLRAKNMVMKLNELKFPLKLEHVSRIAGKGVAPGRLHVARAMVEAGYVENLKQAFTRYLYDGGPAYSTGSEPLVEDAVQLIRETGGLSVLAHPWALKNPVAVVRRLKDAGLHGIEAYRSDGILSVYNGIADAYHLLKVGGSDYHGKGGHGESELGSVKLPVTALHEFLKVARPIWCDAIRNVLDSYAEDPSDSNLARITTFGRTRVLKGNSVASCRTDVIDRCRTDVIDRCLTLWLTNEERQNAEFEAIRLKLSSASVENGGTHVAIESS